MFWMMIKCSACLTTPVLPKHRQGTAYENDELNWAPYYCEGCAEENWEYWNDMWQDYYHSVWG